jgi:hypothetical protein
MNACKIVEKISESLCRNLEHVWKGKEKIAADGLIEDNTYEKEKKHDKENSDTILK